ncbi:MAG TPA: tetratricopeptide repeat protein [Polyangiaceae bacterium]|nr:tetratricopeptide repeat protein [Polyangiaceae bacterium]
MMHWSNQPRFRSRALGCALACGAASTGLSPSADGDIWWHLAAGREMVTRGALLFSDPFSVSAGGRPWVDVHWLFQLAVFAVHRACGLAGLVWVKCALLGLGASLLYLAVPERRGSWARGLLLTSLVGGLLAARALLLLRPVIGTLLLLAFFFLQLERFGRDGRLRQLWPLPVAQVLWANFQGLSALGPAVVAAYAVAATAFAFGGTTRGWPFAAEASHELSPARRARWLLATLGACALASFITPFGVRGATLPAVLLGRLLPGEHDVFARNVAENLSPFVLEGVSGGEQWHFKWSLALFGLAALIAGRRLKLSHALLLLGLAGLAALSNRNVLLFYWLGAPILSIYLGPALWRAVAGRFRRQGLQIAAAFNAALVALLFCTSALASLRESPLSEPSPFRTPAISAERLADLPAGGKLFSADHYGGYLIWRLYPRFRPYIDTRLVLRSAEEYETYLRLADEPERFDAFQARHGFAYVVLPVAFPERYQRLIAHLYESPAWKLLYTDGSEVLFGRRDLSRELPEQRVTEVEDAQQILAELQQRYSGLPKVQAAARLNLSTLLGALGQFEPARSVLQDLDTKDARALEARLRFAAGELEIAQQLAQRALQGDRDDVRSLNLMARIAVRRGEASEGVGFLRRALRARPFDPEATELLAQLEESSP